jgi:hypothetical protein
MQVSNSCPATPTVLVRMLRSIPTPTDIDSLPDIKLPALVLHHIFESRIIHKSKHNTPYDTPSPGRASSEPTPRSSELARDFNVVVDEVNEDMRQMVNIVRDAVDEIEAKD